MLLRVRFALPAALLVAALASQPPAAAQDKDKDPAARAAATANMKKLKIDSPTIEESDNFLVVGTIAKEKAQALTKVLEKTLPVARKGALYTDKDTPWKGKLTVYFLPDSGEFKSFMRTVLQASPEGAHLDLKAEPPVLVDPAELPGKPTDADLYAATAARVGAAVLAAKSGTALVPGWLKDAFGRVAQMRAEGLNSQRYTKYKAAVRGAVLNPKGPPPGIAEAWSETKSATNEAIATSVAEFLAFGPKAAEFGKFLDALRPSDDVPNPTVQNGFMGLGWKEQAQAEMAWKRWLQTGK
jgi:hypothetical protein